MKLVNSTNIEFWREDGVADEVQFDTHDERELAELFWEFLKENGFINVVKGKTEWESGIMVETEGE